MVNMREFLIRSCSGMGFDVGASEYVTVTDVEGGQVADLFAVCADNPDEFFSPSVTIDCHESLRLNIGDELYSNLYRPMFRVVYDEVGTHDLLFPSCRRETYDFFYQNGENHPNCYDNINNCLKEKQPIIQPLNIFMNTKVLPDGRVVIQSPATKPSDRLILQALMDMRVAVAACSVSEGECNAHKCTSIGVTVSKYIFIPARIEMAEEIFEIYRERMKWMDVKGLDHWNKCDYLNLYPLTYYKRQIENGNLYVLLDNESRIIGAVVLLDTDSRWPDKTDAAFYVHNLVTLPDENGVGTLMMWEIERIAVKFGKEYIRLDCSVKSDFLNSFYGNLGYLDTGKRCEDGDYCGIMREKHI